MVMVALVHAMHSTEYEAFFNCGSKPLLALPHIHRNSIANRGAVLNRSALCIAQCCPDISSMKHQPPKYLCFAETIAAITPDQVSSTETDQESK